MRRLVQLITFPFVSFDQLIATTNHEWLSRHAVTLGRTALFLSLAAILAAVGQGIAMMATGQVFTSHLVWAAITLGVYFLGTCYAEQLRTLLPLSQDSASCKEALDLVEQYPTAAAYHQAVLAAGRQLLRGDLSRLSKLAEDVQAAERLEAMTRAVVQFNVGSKADRLIATARRGRWIFRAAFAFWVSNLAVVGLAAVFQASVDAAIAQMPWLATVSALVTLGATFLGFGVMLWAHTRFVERYEPVAFKEVLRNRTWQLLAEAAAVPALQALLDEGQTIRRVHLDQVEAAARRATTEAACRALHGLVGASDVS